MLKFPDSDVNFVVGPAYFLGDFDVYDREDTLGRRLSAFDPNDAEHLQSVFDEFFFKGARVASLSAEHKAELLRVLAEALKEDHFNFGALIHGEGLDGYFVLPESWNIESPRSFFLEIYGLAAQRWNQDLASIGETSIPMD